MAFFILYGKDLMLERSFCCVLTACFILQSLLIELPIAAHADPLALSLPAADQMMSLSKHFEPAMIEGLRYDPQKPFQFQFILQQGANPLSLDQLRDQGMKVVRYFMAAMTIPENDLWVNLSPYEKNRIIQRDLGVTRMGSDMLVEDYILKQLTSSLTYPNSSTGGDFWKQVYKETQLRLGKTDIPISTFNKVWIVPEYAEVLVKDSTIIIADSHLKVMMEQDYWAQKKASYKVKNPASDVMRQVIIPILEKEINSGSHFAVLRQMFHAVILAEWYKRNLRASLFSQSYADLHKIKGIDDVDKKSREIIYRQYLSAYKKGVYNFIREDATPGTSQIVPRKYFSGGLNLRVSGKVVERSSFAQLSARGKGNIKKRNAYLLDVGELPASGKGPDMAMNAQIDGIFRTMQEELAEERRVSSKVEKIIRKIDPTIINHVLEEPVRITEGWEKVGIVDRFISFFHSRVGLNIKRPQWLVLESGNTNKGGIRYYIRGSTLMKEEIFKKGWDRLNEVKAPVSVFRDYIAVYMRNGAWNLAFLMFEKVQLLGLPLGGGKADVFIGNVVEENGKVVIQDLSKEDEKEAIKKIAQRHGEVLAPFVGIGQDSPAPDVGTADLMEIYAEAYIRWVVDHQPEDFRDDELIRLLREKLAEVRQDQGKYPIGEAPLLELLDDYGTKHQMAVPWTSVFTGTKRFGGLSGREEATGIGVITVLTTYFDEMGIDYRGMKMSLQGMGAVGYYAALEAVQKGFLVTHFNDHNIAVIKKDGWTAEQLIKIKAEMKKSRLPWWEFYLEDQKKPSEERVFALPTVKVIINQEPADIDGSPNPKYKKIEKQISDEIIGANVDVLLPAYLGNQITEDNWSLVMAKYIAEGANHPVDHYAQIKLNNIGKIILTGILANAGGVFGSFLQIVQALQGKKFSLEEVMELSRNKLQGVTKQVVEMLKDYRQLSFGEACELVAWTNAARERSKGTVSSTESAPGVARSDSPAMTNGGIDFDTSHMLINQEGESNFNLQTKSSGFQGWRDSKGYVPVFLRMVPVNVLLLMGIKG